MAKSLNEKISDAFDEKQEKRKLNEVSGVTLQDIENALRQTLTGSKVRIKAQEKKNREELINKIKSFFKSKKKQK